jgi:hypothetical protein
MTGCPLRPEAQPHSCVAVLLPSRHCLLLPAAAVALRTVHVYGGVQAPLSEGGEPWRGEAGRYLTGRRRPRILPRPGVGARSNPPPHTQAGSGPRKSGPLRPPVRFRAAATGATAPPPRGSRTASPRAGRQVAREWKWPRMRALPQGACACARRTSRRRRRRSAATHALRARAANGAALRHGARWLPGRRPAAPRDLVVVGGCAALTLPPSYPAVAAAHPK